MLCATRGEAGESRVRTDDLAALREAELRDAAAHPRGRHRPAPRLRRLRDDRRARAGHTLAAAEPTTLAADVRSVVDELRPDVVVTLDASDGHRDHAVIRDATLAAVDTARRPPAATYLWCLRAIVDGAVGEHMRGTVGDAYLASASSAPPTTRSPPSSTSAAHLPKRWEAIRAHASQASPYDDLPTELQHEFLAIDRLAPRARRRPARRLSDLLRRRWRHRSLAGNHGSRCGESGPKGRTMTDAVEVIDQGAGPRVVLVHGDVFGCEMTWEAQEPLAADFHLQLVNRRGFGNSADTDGEDFEIDAGDVADLLDGGAHLVGHSYGGVVALLAAASRPRAVRSLVVFEPPAFALTADDPATAAFIADIKALVASDPSAEEFLARFITAVGGNPEPRSATAPAASGEGGVGAAARTLALGSADPARRPRSAFVPEARRLGRPQTRCSTESVTSSKQNSRRNGSCSRARVTACRPSGPPSTKCCRSSGTRPPPDCRYSPCLAGQGACHGTSCRPLRYRQRRRLRVAGDPRTAPIWSSSGTTSSTAVKAGQDSGELVGVAPAGVRATNDWNEVLGLGGGLSDLLRRQHRPRRGGHRRSRTVPRAGHQRRDVLGVRARTSADGAGRVPRPDRGGVLGGQQHVLLHGHRSGLGHDRSGHRRARRREPGRLHPRLRARVVRRLQRRVRHARVLRVRQGAWVPAAARDRGVHRKDVVADPAPPRRGARRRDRGIQRRVRDRLARRGRRDGIRDARRRHRVGRALRAASVARGPAVRDPRTRRLRGTRRRQPVEAAPRSRRPGVPDRNRR